MYVCMCEECAVRNRSVTDTIIAWQGRVLSVSIGIAYIESCREVHSPTSPKHTNIYIIHTGTPHHTPITNTEPLKPLNIKQSTH